jgi:hypothetical protein
MVNKYLLHRTNHDYRKEQKYSVHGTNYYIWNKNLGRGINKACMENKNIISWNNTRVKKKE